MKEHSAFNALGSYAPPPNIVPPPPPIRCNALLDFLIAMAKNITGSLNQQTRMEVKSMKTLPLKEVLKRKE